MIFYSTSPSISSAAIPPPSSISSIETLPPGVPKSAPILIPELSYMGSWLSCQLRNSPWALGMGSNVASGSVVGLSFFWLGSILYHYFALVEK
jgi:hypothetical protein